MSRPLTRRRSLRLLFTLTVLGCGASKPHANPPEKAMEAKWEIHHQEERRGEDDAALKGYEAMCRQSPPYIRACFDRARLLFDTAPLEEARSATRRVIETFPDSAFCQSAIKRLKRSFSDDPLDGMAVLEGIAAAIDGRDCHDTVLFELAKLARAVGSQDKEIAVLRGIVDRYSRWESQLWDDALWRLAGIYREAGRIFEEKALMVRLLDERKPSYLLGSYASPFHDDALLRLGGIQLDEDDPAAAHATFMALWQTKTSPIRVEGLLGASCAVAATGNKTEACRLLGVALGQPELPRKTRRKAETLSAGFGC